jgi:zinc transporter, ZIP family
VGQAILFALIAASALVIGGAIGAYRPPPRPVTAALLAFAAGALITALAFDLFEEAFEMGGAWRAGAGLFVGATVFILFDTWLDRREEPMMSSGRPAAVGFALLAAVTLDGIPENLAMGVSLIENPSATLLVAIFASNLPESIAGAQKMRQARLSQRRIVGIWTGTAVLLAIPVIVGYAALEGVDDETLAWPLSFAGGAVLASLADTVMPEAYKDAGPWVAWATALGFLLSFLVATA